MEVMFSQGIVKNVVTVGNSLMGTAANGSLAVYSPSVFDFLEFVESPQLTKKQKHSDSSHELGKDGNFRYFYSWDEMMKVFKTDPHSLIDYERVDWDMVDIYNVGEEIIYDVVGDFLDIGLFMDQEPEHFGNVVYGNPRGLFAKILINQSIPWSVGSDTLMHKGKRVMGLVDWFESQDIRCEVVAIVNGDCSLVEVVIKNYDEILDMTTLAIACNTDFFRRCQFKVIEHSPTFRWGYGSGLSGMLAMPDGITIALNQFYNKNDIDAFFNIVEEKITENINNYEPQIFVESAKRSY